MFHFRQSTFLLVRMRLNKRTYNSGGYGATGSQIALAKSPERNTDCVAFT